MKSTLGPRLMLGMLAALCLLIAACGNDDDAAVPPPTATSTPSTTPEPATTTPEPTSEPSPTAAPSPEPTAVPTPALATTLEPTPEATLAPSPEPTIQPTPEASPIATAGTTIEVELAGGKPVNGVRRVRIKARDTVTIIVNGDTTDELHIHGYDLVVPFAPGRPGILTFESDIPGIFEVESHHHGDLVMELEVS
ncbi:hypothetical protein [Candidatus Poriferisocius sp.]|uniref:hypothetical protein n=1 Tax=Candidatus Poriferisocius sp. TaxID=3101276 RepID=UPI003B5B2796